MSFMALGVLIAAAHLGITDESVTRDGDEASDASSDAFAAP